MADPLAGSSQQPPEEPILRLRDVTKTFKNGGTAVAALEHVTLDVMPYQITGLVGPDGSGKTTVMRLATGLLLPDSGQVCVMGKDPGREIMAVQAGVGYMPQHFGLYEDLTVAENLNLYADLNDVPPAARQDRFPELMRMTGLSPFTSRLAGRLSGGMKQKLGLACALVRSPDLLLLDEPTVGVDPVSRRELWKIIHRLLREERITVLLSTAYLDEAERCQEVAVFYKGQVLDQGTPESFAHQMEDRTYRIAVPDMKAKTVQGILHGRRDVIDAVVQGETVRLVMKSKSPPKGDDILPDVEQVRITAIEPRFEDAFVYMINEQNTEADESSDASQLENRPGPPRGPDGTVIQVKDLKRRFGDFYAVQGVSFEVSAGEVFGLLGANGAGKTTTFRMLCGLLPLTSGSVRVVGLDLRRASAAARARIGYMSQKFSLYGDLTVGQNLRFFSSAYGLSGNFRQERMQWALDQFDLSDSLEAVSRNLPLGFKQRLALACALMHEPEVLFLDEPTSGVDPLARRRFWEWIHSLAQQGVTVMVTTHFMEEAEYCDRLAIMDAGEILSMGTPSEIKDREATAEEPEPTIEDAFVSLLRSNGEKREA
jgi:ABC-2 type transport system ATP-binding protein